MSKKLDWSENESNTVVETTQEIENDNPEKSIEEQEKKGVYKLY